MSGTGTPAPAAPATTIPGPVATTDQNPPVDGQGGVPPQEASPNTAPVAGDGAGEGSVGASPPAPAGTPAEPAKPVVPATDDSWKAKKYDKVYARLKEVEDQLTAAKAGQPVIDDAVVNERAQQIAARQNFDAQCAKVATDAKAKYADFPDKINQLRQLVTPGDQEEIAAYGRLVAATLKTGDEAGRILYELGSNQTEAQRIMNLDPVSQGMELAKLAMKKSESDPSGAPAPMNPVGRNGDTGGLIDPNDAAKADKLSTAEWMARRQKHIDARRAAGERVF